MTYLELITKAIKSEGGRKGCSLPTLKKYISSEKEGFQPHLLRGALKTGLDKEVLKQVKGHYKLFTAPKPAAKKAEEKPKKPAAAKKTVEKKEAPKEAKKPAAKAAEKKEAPKEAKKPAAAKKAAAPKKETKKAATKKPAAKKPAATKKK
mmetsp:Transcript_4009/g.13096  ORF Transcript_4009/g.13096 Transcript_4009/m.13096 type:complete len:150 (+) Transcript_4009:268-717(+)